MEGKPAPFFITEFSMVSGLRCSSIPKISTEQSLHLNNMLRDLYFGGSTQIKQDDLVREFWTMFDEGEKEAGKKDKRKTKKGKKTGSKERTM